MNDETATIPDASTSGEPGQQAEAAGVAAPKKKRGKAGAKAAAAATRRSAINFPIRRCCGPTLPCSALNPHGHAPTASRLGIRGDHVLGLILRHLYRAYPRADEGEL